MIPGSSVMATSLLKSNSLLAKTRIFQHVLSPRVLTVRLKFKRPDTPEGDPELLQQNKGPVEREKFPGEFGLEFPKGRIYDKKPFRMELVPEKRYAWCTCGFSKQQPFCDGAHKKQDGTSFVKKAPKFRPLIFTVDEAKEYFLCNCKQTDNRPYCDGTHKREDIQAAVKS